MVVILAVFYKIAKKGFAINFCGLSCFSLLFELTIRGTQRQFSENICSEDDLRSRIFGTFVVKFIACLVSPRIFEHPKNSIIAHF